MQLDVENDTISDSLIFSSLKTTLQLFDADVKLEQTADDYLLVVDTAGNRYCYLRRFISVPSLKKILHPLEFHEERVSWILLVRDSIPSAKRHYNKVAIKTREELCLSVQLPLQNAKVMDNEALTLKRVEHEEDLVEVARIITRSAPGQPFFEHVISRLRTSDPSIICYLASKEKPVAATIIRSSDDDVVVIEYVATIAEVDSQRIQSAVLNQVLNDLALQGRSRAICRVSKNQSQVFKDLGFLSKDSLLFYQYDNLDTLCKINPFQDFPDNGVLKTKDEYLNVLEKIKEARLPKHNDVAKNWDTAAALNAILKYCGTEKADRKVLDAGGETYSSILPMLEHYGYQKLFCINLAFKRVERKRSILYRKGDITSTDFDDNTFDAITCLSVIEHGVDIPSYLKEMYRILKPGGILVTSTDFSSEPIDTEDRVAYGCPVKIFNANDIRDLVETSKEIGFELQDEIDLISQDKVVRWLGLEYTFIYFTLHKPSIELS